jgi:hypothetical protein
MNKNQKSFKEILEISKNSKFKESRLLNFYFDFFQGAAGSLMLDIAASEKDVHADFFNGKLLQSSCHYSNI